MTGWDREYLANKEEYLKLFDKTMQKEQEQYKNNLNAVGGALQQVEKLLSINHANWELEQKGIDIDTGKKLEIKEKEKPKLLNEGEK